MRSLYAISLHVFSFHGFFNLLLQSLCGSLSIHMLLVAKKADHCRHDIMFLSSALHSSGTDMPMLVLANIGSLANMVAFLSS
jgi:hypothetical protein